MKRVLFVSYAFPPVGGAGVQRPSKFVKFLPQLGWEPWVLTAENPSVPIVDEGLLADLPPEATVLHARTLEPSYQAKLRISGKDETDLGVFSRVRQWMVAAAKSLLLPDLQVLWWPRALPKLLATLRREQIDVIFCSGPPFSSLVLAVLAGRVARVPVVVDFRDEWGFSRKNWENMARHWLAHRLDFAMERWVTTHCTDFTAATKTYVQAIRQRHPKVAAGKGHAITNGFDPDDFKDLPSPTREPGRTRILYAGTVWAATSLRHFIQALAEMKERGEAQGVKLLVVGRVVDEEAGYLQDERLGDAVRLLGYKSHREVVRLMAEADILLLTLSDMPGADRIIPGKVFEYIASNRHILALLPEGESARLLRENRVPARIVSPTDVPGVKEALRELGAPIPGRAGNDQSTERFSRLTLTRHLAGVLSTAAAKGRS